MTEHKHEPEKFEPTDWQPRPIKLAAAGVAVFILVALGASALTVKIVSRYRSQIDEPTVFAAKHTPPPPRLQTDEAADMDLYRRRQRVLLSSYEWINRPLGAVRIPIERAMELTARELQGRNR